MSSATVHDENCGDDQGIPLRIMSYNIQGGRGTDDRYDLRRTADVIAAHDPDIVALQEVQDQYYNEYQDTSPTDFDVQHELLAKWLDMDHVEFAANRNYPNENGYRRRAGQAILSKYPIEEFNVYEYEAQVARTRDEEFQEKWAECYTRRLPEAKIDVDGTRLWFYNPHPQAGSDEERVAVRSEQIEEIVAIASERDAPRILAGDFNAPSGEYDFTDDNENYRKIRSSYVDVLREADATEPTFPAPSSSANRRIDYVFATDDFGIQGGRVVPHGEHGPSPSDHLPIVADIALSR